MIRPSPTSGEAYIRANIKTRWRILNNDSAIRCFQKLKIRDPSDVHQQILTAYGDNIEGNCNWIFQLNGGFNGRQQPMGFYGFLENLTQESSNGTKCTNIIAFAAVNLKAVWGTLRMLR
ncbi:unnamed protein product [Clonostachys rosea]|uniref:Uncharacterized protein n=1 Tax=Bionectria ochroleuca TaxID=29856 RepID=A0ABY6TW35_BIOOC|nr:unnamed protein product [Clonostachys rosea]